MKKLSDEFKKLIEKSTTESNLHNFIKRNPEILKHTFSQGAGYSIVFSKFKLSDELIPDFVMIGRRSGTKVTSWDVDMIEIEPSVPNKPLFTKKGYSAGQLREAEKQIRNWQQWMKHNEQTIFVSKALRELRKKHAWDEHPQFYVPSDGTYQDIMIWYRIVVGRRIDLI